MICVTPGHIGISGNEREDEAARMEKIFENMVKIPIRVVEFKNCLSNEWRKLNTKLNAIKITPFK